MADPYGGRPSVPHLQPPEDDVVSTFLYHSLYHHNSDSSNHNNNDNNNNHNSNNNPNAIHNPNHHAPPLLFPVDATSSSGLFPNGVLVAGSGPSSKQPEASSSLNFSDPSSYYFRADVDKIHSGGDFSYVESDVIPDRRENFCDEEKAPGSSDMPSPLVVPRTSSKRSRAAEVHNLSEKRRRSKINEKMKALQKLIPNSDKTDKASMLDEAIEYLKQLQLQVQMLTMRNGLNLHPLCLPGVYQPLHVPQGESSLGDGNKLLDNVGSSSFSMNQDTSMRTAFDISNQCTPSGLPVAPTGTNTANAETPYSYTPVFPAHYGPLNLSTSSKEICRENLPRFQVNTSDAGKSSPRISS